MTAQTKHRGVEDAVKDAVEDAVEDAKKKRKNRERQKDRTEMDNNAKTKKLSGILYITLALIIAAVMFAALYTAIATVARRARAGEETAQNEETAPGTEGAENGKNEKNGIGGSGGEKTGQNGSSAQNRQSAKIKDVDVDGTVNTAGGPAGGAADAESDSIGVSGKEDVLPKKFSLPVSGKLGKTYSVDTLVYSLTMNDYRAHTGIDVCAPVGTAVCACADGVVECVSADPLNGTWITVIHGGGLRSRYCGLSEELPKGIAEGTTLTAGTLIGYVGETMGCESAEASHVHVEMTLDGKTVDPLGYLAYDASASAEDYED